MENLENYYTTTKVAQHLDITVVTLTNWYKWYNDPEQFKPKGMPQLPEYIQEKSRGPKYWKKSDLPKLQKFKEWIPKGRNGLMGSVSSRYWGERGKK